MKLLTEITIPSPFISLSYKDGLLMMGSCFAENIGSKLQKYGFDIDINPFGILYNPLSIASSIERLLSGKRFEEADLFQHNGLWHSFAHHGSFSATTSADAVAKINTRFDAAVGRLQHARFLIITFGTAWVYKQQDGGVVANCHKLPDKNFIRERVSVDDVVACWEPLLMQFRQMNPSIQFIFTVSPVRHWKDGAHENQLSKSVLLLAIDRLKQKNDIAYFPAYELMMDELRDYRFYASDMLHPSDQAIDYIWERFIASSVNQATKAVMKEVEQIRLALAHRPFNPDSAEHVQFVRKIELRKAELQQQYPAIRLD